MPKNRKRCKTHSIDITFSDENATSFGGMILEHRRKEGAASHAP